MPPTDDATPADRFDHALMVAESDIDLNGHANNISYLRWVQDAAVAHWRAAVDPEVASAIGWVVVRHEIDYRKPAFRGDALVTRTWVGEYTAVTSERFCTILRASDGVLLARARTVWCAIDPISGKPKRIDPRLRAFFFGRLPPAESPVT